VQLGGDAGSRSLCGELDAALTADASRPRQRCMQSLVAAALFRFRWGLGEAD
jgi:hypothetical protein